MADIDTIQDSVGVDAPKTAGGQAPKPESNEIKIRQQFAAGGFNREIYDIKVGTENARTYGWKIREGSEVAIHGDNLGIYDRIKLRFGGAEYLHKPEISRDGRTLTFKVSDAIKSLYSEGVQIQLEFIDADNRANNRFLYEKFRYRGETEEEQKEREKKGGKTDGGKPKQGESGSQVISEVLNDVIGGVPEAVGRGLGIGAATVAASQTAASGAASSSSVKTLQQTAETKVEDQMLDADDDVSSSPESEQSGAVSSATEVSSSLNGGGAVVSGGQVTGSAEAEVSSQASSQQKINASATLSQTQRAEVSGGQTVQAGVSGGSSGETTTTVEGKISEDAKISESGRVDSGASANVSSGSQLSGRASVNSSEKAKIEDQERIRSEASAGVQANTGVSSAGAGSASAAVSGEGQKIEQEALGQTSGRTEATTSGRQNLSETRPDSNQSQDAGKAQSLKGKGANEVEAKSQTKPLSGQDDSSASKEKQEAQTKAPGKGKVDGLEAARPKPPAGMKDLNKNDQALAQKLGDVNKNKEKADAAKAGAGKGIAPVRQAGSGGGGLSSGLPLATGDGGSESDSREAGGPSTSPQDKTSEGQPGAVQPPSDNLTGEQGGERNQDSGAGDDEGANQANEEDRSSPDAGIGPPGQLAGGLSAATTEAAALANKFINTALLDAAWWVWVAALPSFGLSILLGAVAGDLLWMFKGSLIRTAITRVKLPLLKGDLMKNEANNIADQIKFSGMVKLNVGAMNLAVAAVAGLILFGSLVFMAAGCNFPIEKSFLTAYTYRGTYVGAFIGDDCKYFDTSNIVTGTKPPAPSAAQNQPNSSSGGVVPRP